MPYQEVDPTGAPLREVDSTGAPLGRQTSPQDPGFWSTLGRHIGHGAMNLVYGGAQIGARMGPEIGAGAFTDPAELQRRQQTVDQATRDRAAQIWGDPAKGIPAEPGTKEHPVAAALGDISGEIAASAPLFALPGALPTWGARALGMAIPGALFGSMQPATTKNVAGEKIGETAGGAVSAVVAQPIGELAVKGAGKYVVGPLYRAGRRALFGEPERAAQAAAKAAANTARAQKTISGKLKEGGAIATDIMKEMQEARAAGQPYTLLDVGSEPVEQLAGTLYRSQTGKQAQRLKEFQAGRITERDPQTQGTAQYTRLRNGIRRLLGSGSVTEATERLANQRATNARPLWDKAMAGGSVAPLTQQFETAFREATSAEQAANQRVAQANARLTALRGRQATALGARDPRLPTGDYSIKGAPHPAAETEEAAAARELAAAQNDLRIAQQDKEAVRNGLQRAQADGTANLPGAVWSPHLQRLFERPDVKRGLRLAEKIEADNAAAENRAFNAYEFAIVGHDANGDPIVGTVPNMKLIQMAKQGLDALLEGEPVTAGSSGEAGALRDPITRRLTKAGLAVNNMRKSLIAVADALNPDWQVAREQWAGDTAMLAALKDGQVAFSRRAGWSLEDFQTRWAEMNPAEREMFKFGIADTLSQDLDFTTDAGFENKAIIKSPAVRNMLYTMFRDSPGDADRFLNFIERERGMYRVGGRVMAGSQTAGREASDIQNLPALQKRAEATRHGLAALFHFKTGHPVEAVSSGLRARAALGWTGQDPIFNEELMRILTDPNVPLSQDVAGGLQVGPQAAPPPVRGATRQYLGAYGTGLPAQLFTTTVEDIFGQ